MNRILASLLSLLLCSHVAAQKLRVESVNVEKGTTVEIVFVNEVVADAVALQMTLALPAELSVDESAISKGTAMEDGQMEWRKTNDNSFLFVFYNQDNAALPDGELLRVPALVGGEAGTYACRVHTVRSANVESIRTDAESLEFRVNVSDAVGIADLPAEGQDSREVMYDLQGRPIRSPQAARHTIYIVDGKKILMK
ncbi:MAG: hypothetical protein IKG96_00290 [Bacteroidaceae bacterium]|nr:hypothetical protein [Bacteroidaceae bacterium]